MKLIKVKSNEDPPEVPEGYEWIDVNETNYAEYREQIEAVIANELKDGTLRLAKKIPNVESGKICHSAQAV